MSTDFDIAKLKEAAEAPEYWVEGVGKISTALIDTMTVKKCTVLALIEQMESAEEQARAASVGRAANVDWAGELQGDIRSLKVDLVTRDEWIEQVLLVLEMVCRGERIETPAMLTGVLISQGKAIVGFGGGESGRDCTVEVPDVQVAPGVTRPAEEVDGQDATVLARIDHGVRPTLPTTPKKGLSEGDDDE